MNTIFHSVTLDKDKCKGCTNCVKRCPTEAIRVRKSKALIISERCIDCGECIRVCPHKAKKAVSDDFDILKKFKYNVALPAPSLYGQFDGIDNIDYILDGLIHLGFDDVFEVSVGAEIVSDFSRKLLKYDNNLTYPVISSACPAVVRLIKARFPSLCKNVLPVLAPIDVAARLAREKAMKDTGLKSEEIGIIFITPCPAKVTAAFNHDELEERTVDGTISMQRVYKKLAAKVKKSENPIQFSKSGIMGVGWAASGGESAALLKDKYLAADGIENVIKVLEEIEDGKLDYLEFIELNACTSGCVGGCLTVENPFVAKARIQELRKYLPVSQNKSDYDNKENMLWGVPLSYSSILKLDDDVVVAMKKMMEIEKIKELLPDIDCGTCGSPSCRAFAEDVVSGKAYMSDCIFIYKETITKLVQKVPELGKIISKTEWGIKDESK